jgi:hypothetical protein
MSVCHSTVLAAVLCVGKAVLLVLGKSQFVVVVEIINVEDGTRLRSAVRRYVVICNVTFCCNIWSTIYIIIIIIIIIITKR